MKKFGSILLLIFYVVFSLGISVTVHYCGGEIDHFAFGKEDNGPCQCGDGPMKGNCCHDLFFGGQSFSDHVSTDYDSVEFFSFSAQEVLPSQLHVNQDWIASLFEPIPACFAHPPDVSWGKIFIVIRSILI